MQGNFKPYNQDQMFLFPKSLKDFIPKGHLVYFINDIVEKFDLSPIIQKYSKNGCRAYAPVMLTKILFYAYCIGVYSSRKIAQRLEDSVFFMYLSAMQRPDFRTISDFRKNHLKELSEFFVQVLRMCQELGMIKFGHISLDGSKVKANASKHKAMSYGRMKKKKDELEREVEELLRRANEIDEEEDKEYGDKRGDELPEELAIKEKRLQKIEEAMRRLEKEAKQEGKTEPDDKKQTSFTDPESKIMKTHHGFQYSYNAQCAVDSANQVIVAQDVTNEVPDSPNLVPMIKKIEENTERKPEKFSADNGYLSQENLEYLEEEGIDSYIAVGNEKKIKDKKIKKKFICPANNKASPDGCLRCNKRKNCDSFGDFLKVKTLEKLKSEEGAKEYKKRKAVVEPVFGQMKWARGFRQFSMRGLEKARGEFALLCTAHNILKIRRFLKGNTCEGSEFSYGYNYFWSVWLILYFRMAKNSVMQRF